MTNIQRGVFTIVRPHRTGLRLLGVARNARDKKLRAALDPWVARQPKDNQPHLSTDMVKT
jgi:hypothetical protein